MPHRRSLIRVAATLQPVTLPPFDTPPPRGRRYRLLVVGDAVLHRPPASGEPWRVGVTTDGSFVPLPPRSAAAWARMVHAGGRIVAVLLGPQDLPTVGPLLRPAVRGRSARAVEIDGWALLYQPAGRRGIGLVDPHTDLPGMPACYESPAELADRQEFLAARGIPTRALAVVSRRTGFDVDDGNPRQRFLPLARWRPTQGPTPPPP